ncbi:MAG: hypothetical protein WC128_04280 [Bacteroidales bacterium]|jgi:hypothetical protein
MKKIHFILLAFILTGCINNSWWEPRTIVTYDAQDQARGRFQFIYDEQGNKFTETGDFWDQETENWKREYRISYSYDIYGIRTGSLKEKRDHGTGKWIPDARVMCEYITNTGHLLKEIHQTCRQDNGLWEDTYKDHYIRDEENRLLYVVREKWNNGEIERDITLRGRFTLKARLTTSEIGWENFIRDSFLYDEDGTRVGGTVDFWNKTTREWDPVFQYIYTYDKKGNVISETEKKRNQETGIWQEAGKYIYTYDDHNNAIESNYIPAREDLQTEHFLIFYYNNMKSSVGYYLGDTGMFPGVRGTAEYFRLKR